MRASGLQLGLVAVLIAGAAFLAWTWSGDAGSSSAARGLDAEVSVPSLRFFTRADGMEVAEVDAAGFTRFLAARGIPPLGLPMPPSEAAVARRMEQVMRALAVDPTADEYGRFGELFDALRMRDQALACFTTAVRLAPDEHRWRHYLGRHLAVDGELPAAEEQFRRAIELRSDYAATHWRLARVCLEQEQVDEARAILRETTRLDAASPYPWTELASLELQAGRPAEARPLLEEALKRDGQYGRAHALMSQTLAVLGDDAGAEVHARLGRYSNKSPDPIPDPILFERLRDTDSVAYHRVQAKAQGTSGPGAVERWERICAAAPGNADDKMLLSNAYFDAGRPDDAVATLEVAMAQEPRGARFRVARAQLALRMGDAAAALRYADEALALEGTPPAAFGVRAIALISLGRVDEAVAPAEAALEHAPDNPEIYAFLGSIYANVGRRADAEATYRKGLQVAPEDAGLRQALAQLQQR